MKGSVRGFGRWAGVAAWWTVALIGSQASAQVNVEPLRKQLKDHGFGARVAASVDTFAGNTQGVIFGSAATVGFKSGRNAELLSLSGDYAKLNAVVSVAKWFGHLRHDYLLTSGFWWEEFAQIESDRFRRVALRELVGTGPRFRLFEAEPFEAFYGVAYLFEHTNLDTSHPDGSYGQGNAHRLSNYLAATLRAHPNIVLSHVTYLQPRFDRPSDYKVLSTTNADMAVAQHLHTRLDVTIRYDSVAPPDIRRSDVEIKSSLEAVF